MDMDYGWRFGVPGDRLWVQMENRQSGTRVFEATLSLARRPMSGPELARVLLRRPAMTVQVVAGIYAHALRLWWRRATFYPHPRAGDPEAP